MKHKMLLILLFVGFAFTSCDKGDFEYEDKFKDSQEVWNRFKKQTNNTKTTKMTTGKIIINQINGSRSSAPFSLSSPMENTSPAIK